MRSTVLPLVCLSMALLSCGAVEKSITVSNGSDTARQYETVEVRLADIGIKGLDGSNLVIRNADGKQIPSQISADGNSVLFQATVDGKSDATFICTKGERQDFDTLAYSRYVPERKDDYAYENNLIAGRIYGPSLKDPRTFGPDIWLKCTERMVINDWFAVGDYHHNHGEGMDCYKVANTLGGGACVPYSGDTIFIGDNWADQKHVCDGPVRTQATFRYPEFDVNGVKVSAERTLTLDANTRLVHWTTVFHSRKDSLDVVLGAVMHNVLSREDGDNFIAFTERASDSRNPERDGNISIGLILDKSFKATAGTIDGHAVLKFKVKCGEAINFWTASGWSHGGIGSPEEWNEYVSGQAGAVCSPLTITISR